MKNRSIFATFVLLAVVKAGWADVIRFNGADDAARTWNAQTNPRGTVLQRSATIEGWILMTSEYGGIR